MIWLSVSDNLAPTDSFTWIRAGANRLLLFCNCLLQLRNLLTLFGDLQILLGILLFLFSKFLQHFCLEIVKELSHLLLRTGLRVREASFNAFLWLLQTLTFLKMGFLLNNKFDLMVFAEIRCLSISKTDRAKNSPQKIGQSLTGYMYKWSLKWVCCLRPPLVKITVLFGYLTYTMEARDCHGQARESKKKSPKQQHGARGGCWLSLAVSLVCLGSKGTACL